MAIDDDRNTDVPTTPRPRRLRAAAIATVALAALAGGTAFLTDNLTNAFGPDSVCGGAVSADAVNDALGWGKVSDTMYGDGKTLKADGSSCVAKVSRGIFGDDRFVAVDLRKSSSLAPFAVDAGSQLFAASANGGSAGAVRDSSFAFALFPADCDSGQQATAKSRSSDAPGLARLAVSVANRAAEQQGCGKERLPAPHELTAAGTDRALDRNAVCGLPGLTMPDTPGGPAYRATVTPGTDPLWTCRIHSDTDPRSSITFTIGTDPRLVATPTGNPGPTLGRAQEVGTFEAVATCQGRPTRFRFTPDGLWDLVPDGTTTWKQFLAAGGKAIGCEPIL
ncbi:hypothetical protein ACFVXG_29625 [Kitasatospora sp. NPDC058162]|uniref:hypothetical protein n=1 Tax=Kitasatospora sp. NPDC058162 TaxID=3346362 RepID=UPI0036DD336A